MTCSSSTISSPDPAGATGGNGGAKAARWLGASALVPLAVLGVLFLGLGSGAAHGEGPRGDALIEQARRALGRSDGIDAEVKLKAALAGGAAPEDVNALMGQALMAQNRRDRARPWLEQGDFSAATAVDGWRSLAVLERLDGDLPAAGRAYDRMLAITPDDPALWVEIGRLRYMGGQHRMAIEAAEHALDLDPASVRALEFRGQLVRDRYGLRAALPWFERALVNAPDDVAVLLDYAATLGELGRASECVTITRRVLQLDPGNARAYYLQAVLAARAGKYPLARGLLARTKGKFDARPGVQFLRGVVELAAGNPEAASEAFEAVLRARPDNRRAQDLLAQAILLGGQYEYATLRFAEEVEADRASPALLTSVARAWEALGDRHKAGELLDRAARPRGPALRILPGSGRIGQLLASHEAGAAESMAESMRRRDPGSYDAQALAGDVQLALGHAGEAQARYIQASEIRLSESLFNRRFAAYAMARDLGGGRDLVEGYLRQNPTSRPALHAAARLAIGSGNTAWVRPILLWLRDNGGQRDVALLSDLAMVEAQAGNAEAAEANALAAYRLQRSSPVATQALGLAYALTGRKAEARALLDKAEAMAGTTPLIEQARGLLKEPA